jgi:F-type H+-transporting ATPase subunit delta
MLDPVTIRYTEALFNLARARGALDVVQRDVERLASAVASEGSESFFDARIPLAARKKRIEPLLAGMHELSASFVGLLFDKRREAVLRQLGAAFQRRLLLERNAAEGVVESARALGAGELAELSVALSRRLGKEVRLTQRVVPALLGGVRVVVENKMLDASVAGRLEGLRKRLLDAPLAPSARA